MTESTGRHRREVDLFGTIVGVASTAGKLGRLRPERVRLMRFGRNRLGRCGLAEDQVYAFVRRVVDELTARDAAEAALREGERPTQAGVVRVAKPAR